MSPWAWAGLALMLAADVAAVLACCRLDRPDELPEEEDDGGSPDGGDAPDALADLRGLVLPQGRGPEASRPDAGRLG